MPELEPGIYGWIPSLLADCNYNGCASEILAHHYATYLPTIQFLGKQMYNKRSNITQKKSIYSSTKIALEILFFKCEKNDLNSRLRLQKLYQSKESRKSNT